MVFQYAVNSSECYIEDLSILLEIVSNERKKKIDRFLFNEDKVRCLLAEVLLRYGLWKHFDLKEDEIQFTYNEFGKPSLGNYEHIHFNISHSGNWVLCGVGDIPLGVDVEFIKNNNLDLAKRYFNSKEYYNILQLPVEQQITAFYKIWTLKESYVKTIGKGLNIPFNSFYFEEIDNMIQLYINDMNEDSYIFVSGLLDKKHCTGLCIKNDKKDDTRKEIKELTVQQLVGWKMNRR